MTWLTVKHLLQKLWIWAKTYWWAGVILVLGFVVYRIFLRKGDVYQQLFHDKMEQGKKELEVVEKAHETHVKKIEEAQQEFLEITKVIEADRAALGKKVLKAEKKRIKEIVAMPEEARVEALASEFGLEVIEVEE
jgi:hypothetical protein